MRNRLRALRIGRLTGAIAVAALAVSQASAGDSAMTLRVGRTGIMCVRLPCPHRGIYRPGAKDMQALRRSLLYADLDEKSGLPDLDGAAAALKWVRDAWDRNACIEIRGRLDGTKGDQRLHVENIMGACR